MASNLKGVIISLAFWAGVVGAVFLFVLVDGLGVGGTVPAWAVMASMASCLLLLAAQVREPVYGVRELLQAGALPVGAMALNTFTFATHASVLLKPQLFLLA